MEVAQYSRKHTANVHDSLTEIRRAIESLTQQRDKRMTGFVKMIGKAMRTELGDSSDEVLKLLSEKGITKALAKEAIDIVQQQGSLTVFSVVDALTRIAGCLENAGDRTEADQKASALLALAV